MITEVRKMKLQQKDFLDRFKDLLHTVQSNHEYLPLFMLLSSSGGTGKSTIFKKVQKDNDETHKINCFCFNANF